MRHFDLTTLWLCVVVWLVGLSTALIAAEAPGASCSDWESCLALHLRNPALRRALDARCSMRCYRHKRVLFTHIPKTGGSSVNIFLRKVLGKRFTASTPAKSGEAGHVFFPDLYRQHPFEIFVTLLREPGVCALSFYHYVNDRDQLPTWLHEASAYPYEHIWRFTFRRDVEHWAATPWVQRSLAQMFLRQFLARIENVTDNVAGTIEWRSKQDEVYPPVVPWTPLPPLSAFSSYLSRVPEPHRCTDYVQVAHLLLARFSAVGTLERLEAFYRILLHRVEYSRRPTPPSSALGPRSNTSLSVQQQRHSLAVKYSREVVDNASNKRRQAGLGARQEQAALRSLQESPDMRCAGLLWRVAAEASRADEACFSGDN